MKNRYYKFVSIKNAIEDQFVEWEISDIDKQYCPAAILCKNPKCKEQYKAK